MTKCSVLLAFVASLVVVQGAFAQAPQSPATPAPAQPATAATLAQTDPVVTALLNRTAASLRQMKSVYADSSGSLGIPTGRALPLRVRVWADDTSDTAKAYILGEGLGISGAAINDGKNEFFYVANLAEYQIEPVEPKQKTADAGITEAVPRATELAGALNKVQSVGKEVVNGQSTQRLRVGTGMGTFDVWVADDATALPVKATGTFPLGKHQTKVEVNARWMLNQPIPPSIFTIAPPPNARQVAEFNQAALQPYVMQAFTGQPVQQQRTALGGAAAAPAQGGSAAQPQAQSATQPVSAAPATPAPGAPATSGAAASPPAVTSVPTTR